MNHHVLKLLKYIKKFLIFIILFCLISLFGVYSLLHSKLEYKATVTIEYTNTDAEKGLAPDGSKIDPTEITSSKNISNVIENLNLNVSADYIRNRLNIEEVIPDEEQEKKDAALQNGTEYEYFPTSYEITFTVDSSKSKEFASDVLNNLISEYYVSYSENHINKEQVPANTNTLLNNSYDYLESVEIINSTISYIIGYLDIQETAYPDYRSAKTGYSFKDLYNIYTNISTDDVPNLFSYIFQNKVTKDYQVLIEKYKNRINKDKLDIKNKKLELKELKSLIDSYAKKSKEQNIYNSKNENNDDQVILKDIEESSTKNKTTYDDLIIQYVGMLEEKDKLYTDINYCKNVLKIYNKEIKTSKIVCDNIKEKISDELKITKHNYEILAETSNELNEVLGADNINTASNIVVVQSFNLKLYMTMAIVVFLVIGCCGSIVIGRLYDIIFNILYVDKKTGLYNRIKCDQLITDYATNLLDEKMTVIVFEINNLVNINKILGRYCGDELLKNIGISLQKVFPTHSNLSYNGPGEFLLFIEDNSLFTINSAIDKIEKNLKIFKEEKMHNEKILYNIVYSNAKEENIYNIRELISKTYQKLNERKKNEEEN